MCLDMEGFCSHGLFPKKKHWILVAINMQTMSIRVYDSMSRTGLAQKHIYEVCITNCLYSLLPHCLTFQRILRFLTWESHSSDRGEIPAMWCHNLKEYMRSEGSIISLYLNLAPCIHPVLKVPSTLPQQSNSTDCGVYLVAFAKKIARGGDPEAPTYSLSAKDIECLRTQMGQRLAKEWQSQQGTLRESPSYRKSMPAPFPLSQCITPLKHMSKELGEHNEIHTTDDNVILSSNLREMYVPRVNTWAVWRLAPGELYFPARITTCDTSSLIATFRVFYDVVPLPHSYEFVRTFAECYDVIGAPDNCIPELQSYQVHAGIQSTDSSVLNPIFLDPQNTMAR
jgi:Ulp1 protease family, C-terminal catalytic domain